MYDVCKSDGSCEGVIDWCNVVGCGDACYTCNPGSNTCTYDPSVGDCGECRTCDPDAGGCAITEGEACDDGNMLTPIDICNSEGECEGRICNLECDEGGCNQENDHMVCCDGGQCDQDDSNICVCDGGFCSQVDCEWCFCEGGYCDQTGCKNPSCPSGNCDGNCETMDCGCNNCQYGECVNSYTSDGTCCVNPTCNDQAFFFIMTI